MDPREQFSWAKRFRHKIVGTYLQPHYSVNFISLGSKHDHRCSNLRLSKAFAHRQPVFPWQYPVQHDEIQGIAFQQAPQRSSVFGYENLKSFLAEVALQQLTNPGIVIYHRNTISTGSQ